MDIHSILKNLDACSEGVEYVGNQSPIDAWNNCDRGDWMLWISDERKIDLKVLTKAKVECAKLVEHLMADERSINAMRVAERFAYGEKDLEDTKISAADSAADAAADTYAAYASSNSYYYAARAAHAAVDESYSSAAAAVYAATAVERKETLKKCADICRKHIDFKLLKL